MKLTSFRVQPRIPESLKPLWEIAHNAWFSWNFDAVRLFIRMDHDAWDASKQNPAGTLGMVSQERLDELAEDDSFLAALAVVQTKLSIYREADRWYEAERKETIAYFSMEYGLDKSLPMYSGGLGVLSGDHIKTSSDIGLPMVGVGLLYRQGYFQQYLNADGFQQESYPENDWYNMPVYQELNESGEPVVISVTVGSETVHAAVWSVRVGRNPLYLLDTNIERNSPRNRRITAALYGGDREMRIRQEIVLGMGGIRALKALGIEPAVVHMNEGHSAFLALERIRMLMDDRSLSFQEAREAVWATNVFTTHTPVPAGNERFEPKLMERYFRDLASQLGLSWDRFMELGRENPSDGEEHFCMTVLALKLSAHNNAVSRLHGQVSRAMWAGIWPKLPADEIPINHVTNGIHPRTWISHDMLDLLDRYFGPSFAEKPEDPSVWDRMARISDEELWRTHERRRERLVAYARHTMKSQLKRRGATTAELHQTEDVLSPYALTISFARRFATYKRSTLLFRDRERLIRLLSDVDRPVQLIFAGKAHPHDIPGKEMIREIFHFSNRPEVRSRILFLEDYDMLTAKNLVAGSDLWINTPRRPLEASGTSGMKAAMNGALNCSILDGWWAEAYRPEIGWPIGNGEEYDDTEFQDQVESNAVYNLLEREIVPLFYDRGRDGLPREWIKMMKAAMAAVGQEFSSHRMLVEYTNRFYSQALRHHHELAGDSYRPTRKLADYLERFRSAWNDIKVQDVQSNVSTTLVVGDDVTVSAVVNTGGLSQDEILVQLYYGKMSSKGLLEHTHRCEMACTEDAKGSFRYEVTVHPQETGRLAFGVRVMPRHPNLAHSYLPALTKWYEGT